MVALDIVHLQKREDLSVGNDKEAKTRRSCQHTQHLDLSG